MTYGISIKPSCQEAINKLCKKNPELRKAIENKIKAILEYPQHYKPLKYDLVGEKRVHIMKSFVLKYEVDENNQIVTFISFSHHDDAYKR